MNRTDSITLAEKCLQAEVSLAGEFGDFALFSLIQREATAGKWDVVVSAPWLNTNRAGIQQVVDELKLYLSAEDWLLLGSVVPLESNTSFVRTMTRMFHGGHQLQEIGTVQTDDFTLDRAIIITANPHPMRMSEYQAAAA
jgi:hypothetical protein